MEEGAGIGTEGSDGECDEISDGRRHQKKMVEEKEDVMMQVTEKEDRRNGEGDGIKCQKKAAKKRRKT